MVQNARTRMMINDHHTREKHILLCYIGAESANRYRVGVYGLLTSGIDIVWRETTK